MFLGMARGSVGDVTFARVKGQQVGRARNRRPNNPRTQSQMTQRSSFMSAVKFFAKGRQNYFTFAFEGKKANESDYNAFMRLNSKKGYQMTKEIYDNPNYPAVGEWQLSQGSLKDIATAWQTTTLNFAALLGITTTTLPGSLTLGEVSQKLIATGEYMAGDILTFGQILTDSVVEEGSDPMPIAWSEDGITWQLSQFILNPSSSEILLDLIPNLGINVDGVSNAVSIVTNSLENASVIGGFFATHSRKTLNGLKVSNTYMRNNDASLRAIELSRTDAYNAWVLSEWQARELAILEGALSADSNEAEQSPVLVLSADTPIEIGADQAAYAVGICKNVNNLNVDDYIVLFEGTNEDGDDLIATELSDQSDFFEVELKKVGGSPNAAVQIYKSTGLVVVSTESKMITIDSIAITK